MNGYVLAGGRSSRMGCDKARLPCRGLPMALSVAEAIQANAVPTWLIRRGPDGLPWQTRGGSDMAVLWESTDLPLHPLNGVFTALTHAGGSSVLVAPCDLPDLAPDHVQALLAAGPCVAVGPDGQVHPLLAIFPADRLHLVEQLLRDGGPARRAVEGLHQVELPAAALRNANRPEDRPPSPLVALAARLPAGIDVARVLDGEGLRLRSRGIVDGPLSE